MDRCRGRLRNRTASWPGPASAEPVSERAAVLVGAAGHLGQVLLHRVEVAECSRRRRRRNRLRRVIRSLVVVDPRDELRDHEIEIGVALPMCVRAHVDRHAGEIGREIGAVIEIEAAQEILVRLAGAAVLGDDHARDVFQHFARPQQRAIVDELRGDDAGARGIGGADARSRSGR